MGNFFGLRRRTPQVTVTKQDRAILQLKQQRDKIRIYQRKTEAELANNKELALKLFQNGLKERALVVMKRRKCMEDIINRTDKQLETLEQMVADIEFTQAEVSVVEGLKIGGQALKELTSLMNIDDIQQMMDDTQEAAEKQREITDILARSSERFDESELLQELDLLSGAKEVTKEPEQKEETQVKQDEPVDVKDTIQKELDSAIEQIPAVPEGGVIATEEKANQEEQEIEQSNSPDKKVSKEAEDLLVPA